MLTFGEFLVIDDRTLRPIVGVAQVTDATTGAPLDTFNAAGDPAPVVSSARGYVGQFHTADDHPLVRLTFPEGDPVVVAAREAVTEAATVVNTIERGRLSPDVLSATIGNVVEAKAGNVPMFGTQAEALAFEAAHPGQVALWFDAGYQEVTAAGPTWTDIPVTGGGNWSTPTEPGVIYTPASGTAEPGETITVVAAARPGYALIGAKSWTHTFPMSSDMLLTDFTTDTVGEMPAGWVPQWVVPTTMGWTVVEHLAGTGGKVLEHRASTNERRALAWAALDPLDTTDVELVFKWRTSTPGSPVRGVVRAAGSAGAEVGYHGAVRNGTAQAMGLITLTTAGFIGNEKAAAILANTWYITRFRINGGQLNAKTWAAADAEPAGWDLTATDTTLTSEGFVGLYCFGAGVALIDWVGVAVGGKTAPKGA